MGNDELAVVLEELKNIRSMMKEMDEKISLLDLKLDQIKKDTGKGQLDFKTEDIIQLGNEEYICLRSVSEATCIKENVMRKIGFDICIEEDNKLCGFALKIEK